MVVEVSSIPYAKIFGEPAAQTTLKAFLDDSARNMSLAASQLADSGANAPPRCVAFSAR
jgi:hypothetical protein